MTGSATTREALSFVDPHVQRCPFPHYERLRDEQPVYRDPVTGNYVLTRYDDIRKAALNVAQLSNRTGLTTREDPAANRIYAERGWVPMDTLANNDPPSHRTYRALVDKVFTPARVKALEPGIQQIIDELVGNLGDGEDVDFLAAFAVPLPMFVIAEQLGVARAHIDRFKRWSNVSVELVSPAVSPEREIYIAETLVEMQQYLAEEIDRARAAPNDRLISQLATIEIDGRVLDKRELLGIIHQILVAGNETTTTTLASAMSLLIEKPDLAETLRNDAARIPMFIEEVLRLQAPIQALFRKATEEIEIGGVTIAKGAIVELRFGSANRDPRQFACPAEIDLDRANARSHLAFGYGLHLCIGNQLARTELRLGLETLLRQFGDFRLARGEDSHEWITSFIAYGPTHLWIQAERAR